MADGEPQQQSIQARIAALNVSHVGRAPITAVKKPPPPLPVKRGQTASIPTAGSQSQTIGNQPNGNGRDVLPPPEITRTGQRTNGTKAARPAPSPSPRILARAVTGPSVKPAAPPRLPARTESAASVNPTPALPPRRPSEMNRRDSQESVASPMSSMSALSVRSGRTSIDGGRVRAPVFDPAALPPLPPKRTQEDKDNDLARFPDKAGRSPTSVINKLRPSPQAPCLPRRTSAQDTISSSRRLPPTDIPPLPPRRETGQEPPVPARLTGLPTPESTPPPVPTSTRPDLSKIMASKPKTPAPAASGECLQCRDFSAADAHAANFPRDTVPSNDWLAAQLTQPFPSATDKARAIFTWLHHNVDYNVQALYSGTIKPSTPESTLRTGLAVCEGYAGLYCALATKAGLACIVVGGHGKGFGFAELQPGQPLPPPDPSGHAWNAVQIDGGAWKLLDACWGAGAIGGAGQPYSRGFTPGEFTRSNEDFGRTHYPQNPAHFFRADGRAPLWEEYIRDGIAPGGGEPVQVYSDVAPREGFDKFSFAPRARRVSADPAHGTVRFQFARVCAHWDPLRNGPARPTRTSWPWACPRTTARAASRTTSRSATTAARGGWTWPRRGWGRAATGSCSTPSPPSTATMPAAWARLAGRLPGAERAWALAASRSGRWPELWTVAWRSSVSWI